MRVCECVCITVRKAVLSVVERVRDREKMRRYVQRDCAWIG